MAILLVPTALPSITSSHGTDRVDEGENFQFGDGTRAFGHSLDTTPPPPPSVPGGGAR